MAPRTDSTQSVDTTSEDVSPMPKNDAAPPSYASTCEQLYGPYPDATPQPWKNSRREGREGDGVCCDDGSTAAVAVDFRDAKSPDDWIPRDGRLVRLTGKHPFNVEPPLRLLREHGFLTPPHLHYVRNHGACPRLSWESHTVSVSKSSDTARVVYTMDQIASLTPARELPVTLVCAGNRRKEQNLLRQTIGFNWGGSGVSTNVYRGVRLRDLLLHSGVVAETDTPSQWHGQHVEFLGAEDLPNKVGVGPFPDQEPWGKLVKYGTSIPLARAMNPAYDVLIAYEANGAKLQPDHGFPVRLIIPGYIGGRMVKWLAAINVIDHETRNHYHYHDNRILPPQITAEEALKGGWWYKPEYIFNELNINSVVASPDHNETLDIAAQIGQTYAVTGYAYTGGGRKITRVEVSTDNGTHWELATLHRKEQPTEHGMHWCWVWWTYELPVSDLVGCTELICRAWDESNNAQPMNPTWNLMGMGHNPVFRVKVHCDKIVDDDKDTANNGGRRHVFRFEHPTQPGQQTGGWMTRAATKPDSAGFGRLLEQGDVVAAAAGAPAAAPPPPGSSSTGRRFTLAEVQKHDKEDDCWIIVKDRVYDATEYLELHPGGIESITMNAGMDATEDFVAIHSTKATKMLEKYYIGDLDKTSVADQAQEQQAELPELVDEQGRQLALHPRKKVSLRLQNKIVLSRDSFLLDFALPTPEHVLGLPTGKHVFMSATIGGETVLRRYTPISSNYDVGCVKFVIKCYRPCERFPDGGKMTQHIDKLDIGDYLDFKGPVGEFEYLRDGRFRLEGVDGECRARCYNMLAGGTGITPCMQIAAEILRHPHDTTKMSLIFACRVEEDLLMRSTLDEWAAQFPDRFRVHYILSDAWSKDWQYSTGFVDQPLFAEHLYPAADDVYNLMCGPPVMLQKSCVPNLEALGHQKSRIFSF